jgi:hypothetical protein
VSVQSADRHLDGFIADTAVGSTICPGKGYRCGSSFVFDGSFAIRRAVDTAYLLKVYRRLYSDMPGATAG